MGRKKKVPLTEAEAKYYGVAGFLDKKYLVDIDCYYPLVMMDGTQNKDIEIADIYVIKKGWVFKQEDIFCMYDAMNVIKVMYQVLSASEDKLYSVKWGQPVIKVTSMCKGFMGDKKDIFDKYLDRREEK